MIFFLSINAFSIGSKEIPLVSRIWMILSLSSVLVQVCWFGSNIIVCHSIPFNQLVWMRIWSIHRLGQTDTNQMSTIHHNASSVLRVSLLAGISLFTSLFLQSRCRFFSCNQKTLCAFYLYLVSFAVMNLKNLNICVRSTFRLNSKHLFYYSEMWNISYHFAFVTKHIKQFFEQKLFIFL